jgi:hypothetical protein
MCKEEKPDEQYASRKQQEKLNSEKNYEKIQLWPI